MEGGTLVFSFEKEGAAEQGVEHYFAIKRGLLTHAATEEELLFRGEFINVEAFETVHALEEDALSFKLVANEMNVKFTASSEEERAQWVHALASLMGIADDSLSEDGSSDLGNSARSKGSKKLDTSTGPPRLTGKAAQLMAATEEGNGSASKKLATKFGMGLSSDMQQAQHSDESSRVYYSLHITLSEAKNLKVKSSGNFFAIASMEHDVVLTRTVTANNNDPLWAEAHQMQVYKPEKHPLHVSVWDANGIVGELQLPLLPLLDHPAEPGTWWKLFPGKSDTFVTGGLKVRVEKPLGAGYLTVTVMEGRYIARRSGFEHYFVKVSYARQEQKTKSVKRVLNPVWNESLQFNLKGNMPIKLEVIPFGKFGKTGPSLGTVTITPNQLQGMYFQEWLVLQPEVAEKRSKDEKDVGEIRLDLSFSKHQVYPAAHYVALSDYLLAQPLRIVSIFEKSTVVQGRERIANCLVKIFEGKNKAPTVLKAMITHEAQAAQGIDTLFRANTIGSKAIDMFMKLVAKQWLYDIVFPTVKVIYKERKSFEIDANKLDKGEDARKNFKALTDTLTELLSRVYAHKDELPNSLRVIFHHITVEVEKRFPEEKDVRYIGVSGFLFLRFIGAAILGPKLFEIMEDHPEPKVLKSLTMLSKVIVKIASMVVSEHRGEGFVGELDDFIHAEQVTMRQFLDSVAIPKVTSEFNPAAVLMEQELSNLCEYFEETLADRTFEKFYLDADIDIDTLDRLLQIMDEMAITEGRRKPALTALRKARHEKGLPPANPEAYGKPTDDLKEKATHAFSKVKRTRSNKDIRALSDDELEEGGTFILVPSGEVSDRKPNSSRQEKAEPIDSERASLSKSSEPHKKRDRPASEKAPNMKNVGRATTTLPSGQKDASLLSRRMSKSKMVVTVPIPALTSSTTPPASPTTKSKADNSSQGKKIVDVNNLAAMYDGMKNAAMALDSSGIIMYNNPGISKLLALPVERIVGTSLGLYLTGAHKKVMDPNELQEILNSSSDSIEVKGSKGRVTILNNVVALDGFPVYVWTERT